MFSVPNEVSRILRELRVPGTPETQSHVTVIHFGDDIPVEQVANILPVVYQVTSSTRPFSMMSRTVGTFDPGDNGTPVIAFVESPDLHRLRERLLGALDAAGISYSTKFKEYRPHVTITYSEENLKGFEHSFTPVSWGAYELSLWGANRGDGELVVAFPFNVGMTQAVHARALVKLASWDR